MICRLLGALFGLKEAALHDAHNQGYRKAQREWDQREHYERRRLEERVRDLQASKVHANAALCRASQQIESQSQVIATMSKQLAVLTKDRDDANMLVRDHRDTIQRLNRLLGR